jgi:KDO2-lipid IV(A) lauroyltransferase
MAARVLARVIDGSAWAGSRVPVRVAHALAVVGGNAEWALRPAKRRRLAANLAHAVGRDADDRAVRRLVRRELVNEARRSADLLWALGRPAEFLASVDLQGVEHARDAIAAGRGMILAGIHVGGWELATPIPGAALPAPTTAIVADDWLAWAIQGMRTRVGLRIMYRTDAALRAARLLRAGEVVLLLGDDGWGPEPRTHRVRFLDQECDLPAGMVALARLCQSPIVGFLSLPVGPRRWRVTVYPGVPPPARDGGVPAERALLQELADQWSGIIRANPQHWAAAYRIRWQEGA